VTTPTVGFVGLGNMGSALAANLVDAGHAVITHDVAGPARSPAGATFVTELDELARGVQIVVLSLPDGNASATVVNGLIAADPSRVTAVIDTSTIGLVAARELSALASRWGIDYIDAPVSGGVAGARARTLAVMFAGSPSACDAALPVIEGLSDRRIRVGDHPGMAQAVKLANNFLSATALAATSEAVAFATAAGVEMSTMLEVVNASSGRSAASEDKFVNHVLPESYSSGFANTLMAKDVDLYLRAAESLHSPATMGRLTAEIWRRFADADAAADFTRIYPFTLDAPR
jgi:3-hydroxyisobutyrate dehydrogenase-like beta-hydroxyacid dehydrogenase